MSFGLIAFGLGATASTATAIGVAGATVGSAVIGSKAQKKAAKTQAQSQQQSGDTQLKASTDANALIREQFQQTQAQLQPFITGAAPAFQLQQAQSGALGSEAQQQAFQDFNESPGVAFLRERGLRGIDRNAAASGALVGGNTDKARIAFSQGLAQQDFGNQFNRLQQVTGTGLSAANALAGVGTNTAAQQGANIVGAGQGVAQGQANAGLAMAQGRLGQANTFSSSIGDLSAIFGNSKLFGNQQAQASPLGTFNQQTLPNTRFTV